MITFKLGQPLISLTAIQEDNLEKLRNWRNDESIRRWCRQIGEISEIQQRAWFERIQTDPSIKMFQIMTTPVSAIDSNYRTVKEQNLVGVCGLTSIDHIRRSAEFSIYIGPEFQRKGHAKAALGTLLLHGFKDLGLNRIWGESFEGNPGIALYEKLGLKKEGHLRETYFKDGRFIDTYIYSILASDQYLNHLCRS